MLLHNDNIQVLLEKYTKENKKTATTLDRNEMVGSVVILADAKRHLECF